MNKSDPERISQSLHRRTLRRFALATLIVLLALAAGAGRSLWLRHSQSKSLAQSTPALGKQYVVTVRPSTDKDAKKIELPGTLQGYIEAPIYARSNGYLLRWYKDIGSKVQKGEVLADIDTPEVDQQLAQAVANKRQSAANLDLAKSTMERWEQMRQRDVVSQQELDERKSAYTQNQATLAAADAEVQRLQNLTSFKRITAPFAGVVTRRNVDIGDLINPGNGDPTHAMFLLSQANPLKVYVYVPQSYATDIKVGQEVEIRLSEMPGQVFRGKINNTAGAIDSTTRTLQIEVVLPNPDLRLLPGAYVKVSLASASAKSLTIPSNTMLFRPEGTLVALVGPAGKVHLQPVTIGQDFGNNVEIVDGIAATDQLILNPSDSLSEGDIVTATETTAQGKGNK